MKVERILPEVDLATRFLPGSADFPVQAAFVRGSRHRVVVDTLIRPADMLPFGGATLVVYTHSDWDHCWGTAAFPGVPVIGHNLTRQRLLNSEVTAYLAQRRQKEPDAFEGSAVVPPDITFEGRLSIDIGGLTLCLEHLPGHTADSIVVHVPELNLLLAGDALERPIPSLNEAGHIRAWARALRRWCQAGVTCVVPSHGRHGGPDLLQQNLDYIEALLDRTGEFLQQGLSLTEIQARIKVEEFVPEIDRYPSYYRRGHLQNLAQVVAELAAEP